jgi:hypothetical protein
MDNVTLLLLSVLPCLVIAAGLRDLTTMKIPNWISGLLILPSFPRPSWSGLPPMIATHVGVAVRPVGRRACSPALDRRRRRQADGRHLPLAGPFRVGNVPAVDRV